TKARLRFAQDWLLGHARQLMTYPALILGAYLAVSGLVHLSRPPAESGHRAHVRDLGQPREPGSGRRVHRSDAPRTGEVGTADSSTGLHEAQTRGAAQAG